jgi:hypothetical protein
VERESKLRVEHGDNSKYAMRGVGTSSFQLESGDTIHIQDVLYVLGFKRNLLSISTLEDKGYRVSFVNGKVLVWPKGLSIDSATMFGV